MYSRSPQGDIGHAERKRADRLEDRDRCRAGATPPPPYTTGGVPKWKDTIPHSAFTPTPILENRVPKKLTLSLWMKKKL